MITDKEKQVLADLVSILNALGLPMMVVGAGARLIGFDQQFGEGRGTKDWDVAISINSWKTYQQVRERLSKGDYPCFKQTRISHKFIHIKTNIEVDLVPFGEIGEPDQEIVWSETGNVMNVLGFSEALSTAKIAKIDDLELQVIDTPGLIVLKIFAWGDRRERTQKDLEDIEFVLAKYEDYERVYTELAEELAEGIIDFMDANVYLLGQDIYKILQKRTLIELNSLLDELITSLDDEPMSLGYRLKILKQGINAFSS